MFAKLAFKNIKRSVKDYAIYFFTLVLGVAIFYVFNSLESQSVMLDVTERVRDILEVMNIILGVVSVFVSFILGALIIYASRFLIKRRGKEFGLYLTLGMGKRKISLILLFETFLIGLFSLVVGLVLGVIASQFVSMLVANMFDANMTNFHFVFSWSAVVKTLIYFGIIYVIVMIFNTIIVSRQKLINLLSSNRRNEKIKLKNPWFCTIVFVIAAIILAWAYYLVTDGLMILIDDSDGIEVLLIPIVMGVVATFLLFWSLSGLLLRIAMSFKNVYYRRLNSFILRQFSSKINTTVISMSLICLMLFTTVCILGSALSIDHTLHKTIEQALPYDVQVSSIGRNSLPITDVYARENVNVDELLQDMISYKVYRLEDMTVGDTVGETTISQIDATDINNTMQVESFTSAESFVYVSDYNRAATAFGLPRLDLADDEYAILANFQPLVDLRNQALKIGQTITVQGITLHPWQDQCIEGAIELEITNMNTGIIIVSDVVNLKADQSYQTEILLGNFADVEHAEEIEQKLYGINNRFYSYSSDEEGAIYGPEDDEATVREIYYYNVESRQAIIDNNVGTSALVTFVGLYLGMIFLISSAAVLALKELSESSDNRDKYATLRRLGASNQALNRALFWQIFIFFIFPVVVAILHSVFGLMFCNVVLSTLGGINIAQIVPRVAAILFAIYGGYFLITYFCSRNIIREHRN